MLKIIPVKKSGLQKLKYVIYIPAMVVGLVLVYLSLPYLHVPVQKSLAAASGPTQIKIIGTATAPNTGANITFDATPYNSNVTLDNTLNQFAGYAWSTDLGWIAFGSTDNPDGPVAYNPSTGALSGKARVINTGADIDFNASPYNSNVVVNSTTGAVTGYAWSDDLGWIDFSNVKIYLAAPNNPTTFAAYDSSGQATGLTTDTWYNHPNPYFSWSGATDSGSGVAGYYVYFGTDSGASPQSAGAWQTAQSKNITQTLASGTTYYLIMQTVSNVGGITTAQTYFTYKFDAVAPTNPTTVNGYSDSGKGTAITNNTYYNYTHPYFEWSGATDTSGSGIAGYYVYFGTDLLSDVTTAGAYQTAANYTVNTSMTDGTNYYLRIRAKDNAGNLIPTTDTDFTYRYTNASPTLPQVSGYDTSGKVNPVTSGSWYAYPQPYFEWTASASTPGVSGYYVYYGTNASADPQTQGSWQTGTNYTYSIPPNSAMSAGTTYHLRIRARDNANNLSDAVDFVYKFDNGNPSSNPTTFHSYSASDKNTPITTATWYNSAQPYFEWDGATDNNSGVAGYWVYFGTDSTAIPKTAGTFQTAVSNTINQVMTSGTSYYFIMQTQNNAGGVTSAQTYFAYQFDNAAPTLADMINTSPVGCSVSGTFELSWQAAADPAPGSGFKEYEYKLGSQGQLHQLTDLTLSVPPYQEGDNVFYLRAKDNAGNTSAWQTAVFCSTGVAYLIDGPKVTAGPSSMEVTWVSSKQTTGFVKVYDGNTYVSEQGQNSYSSSHDVSIIGLKSENNYRYQLTWTDSSGNSGESDWFNTTTAAAPQVSNLVTQLISPSSVIVSWQTNYAATSEMQYGTTSYDTSIAIPGQSSSFSQQLNGLAGGTTYQLRVKAVTADGTEFWGGVNFTTPPLPAISNMTFEPVAGKVPPAETVKWDTNVETTSSLYYGEKGANKTEISQSEKTKKHAIEIDGLNDSTAYEVYAAGTDQYGNSTKSDLNTFLTPLDTTPPVISDLTIETSNVGNGQTDKAQIAVSWVTNKSATSMVEYAKGVTGGDYTSKTTEDKALVTQHLVIISDLTPSVPYHLHVVSTDKNGNIGKSDDSTAIPGAVQKSILQIILQALQNIFGWLGKLAGSPQ